MATPSASAEKTVSPSSILSPTQSQTDGDGVQEDPSVHASAELSDCRDSDSPSQSVSDRSKEYRLLFRLPPDEVLVQDFNCALQENILIQGHLYLFLRHLCFYSNIFGFETKKVIPLCEVTCVRKAKTAAIFPNAIEILYGGKKHVFGSFLFRDEAYRLITDSWSQQNSSSKILLEESRTSGFCEGNANVITQTPNDLKRELDGLSFDRNANGGEPGLISTENAAADIVISENSEIQQSGSEEGFNHQPKMTTLNWQPEDIDAPIVPEVFTLLAEAKFPISVEIFFRLFVSDDGAKFLEGVHKLCGDKELQRTPWEKNDQFGHYRVISFFHPIKIYLGAKFGHCREVQKFRVYRNSHLVIETSKQISDAPFADHFTVEGIWHVKQDGQESCCTLKIYLNVAFSKKTIFRGKIDQATKDECKDVCALWIKNAHEILKERKAAESPKGTPNVQSAQIELPSNGSQDSPPAVILKQDVTNATVPVVKSGQENLSKHSSRPSILKQFWDSFISFPGENNFHVMLLMIFLMFLLAQVSIIVLLARSPSIYVVKNAENYVRYMEDSNRESVGWIEKRLGMLRAEMRTMESHMDRMRHEMDFLLLQLQRLEKMNSD